MLAIRECLPGIADASRNLAAITLEDGSHVEIMPIVNKCAGCAVQ